MRTLALVVAGAVALASITLVAPRRVEASGTPASLTTLDVAYTQNFDSLASAGTSSALPVGWALAESGTNANATYAADTGSSTAGNTYSYGASGGANRAFGELQSGSLLPTIGACFSNDTGGQITSVDLAYSGEEWRLGTAGRADRIDFQYSTDATSLTTGTWTDVDALDYTTTDTTGSAGARTGQDVAHINADYPASLDADASMFARSSDHDAVAGTFALSAGGGVDTVGLVAASVFFLRNSNSAGPADIVSSFGTSALVPIRGDWDGNGTDTEGAYDPTNGTFYLRNSNTPGPADVTFTFGAGGAVPLSGDWDGNGTDTVGLYVPATGTFFLENTNAGGGADIVFIFGAPGPFTPLGGNWDGF